MASGYNSTISTNRFPLTEYASLLAIPGQTWAVAVRFINCVIGTRVMCLTDFCVAMEGRRRAKARCDTNTVTE